MKDRLKLAVLALLALLAGCATGQDEDAAVITLGSHEVTRREFEQAFQKAMAADSTLGPDEAGIRKFADKFVDDELIQVMAEDSVPEIDPVRQFRLGDFRERTMVDLLRNKEYLDEANVVTDDELQEAYRKLGRMLNLRFLVVETEPEANEIRRAVLGGAVFRKIAADRNIDEQSKASEGEIGWITYTQLDASHRDEVFSLKPGQVSRPLPRSDGYALYWVEDEAENTNRGTLEQERANLELGIREQKIVAGKRRYEEHLFEKYGFSLDPVEIAWMTVQMREKTRGVVRGAEILKEEKPDENGVIRTQGEIPWQGLPVAPADTARVLATYGEEGRVTPLLVYDQLMTHATPTWPRFETARDVEDLIRELVLERLEIREAVAQGFPDDPEVIQKVAERRREIQRRQFLRQERIKLRAPDDELRAEYERRIAEFTHPERRRFVAINVAQWDRANEIAKRLRAGESIDDIGRQYAAADTSFRSTGSKGTPPMQYGQSPALDDVLFSIGLNEVSDPIPVGRTFTVAKVIDIQPETVTPFEQARDQIQGQITADRLAKRVEVLREQARKLYPVKINWEALRRIRVKPAGR